MCPRRGRPYARPMLPLSLAGVVPSVRDAEPSDHRRIRGVLRAAYREYAAALPPAVFDRYLQDILDLHARARTGRLIVAEHAGRIVGTVTFYGDAAAEGVGWPSGWAGLRALGVDPTMRRLGIGRALMRTCVDRARAAGAVVLCLHTAEFMAGAVAMYETMGFRRAPSFDFDATALLRLGGTKPVRIIAYRLHLPGSHPDRDPHDWQGDQHP
jgi:predicted N-acetyltransferase YhbS